MGSHRCCEWLQTQDRQPRTILHNHLWSQPKLRQSHQRRRAHHGQQRPRFPPKQDCLLPHQPSHLSSDYLFRQGMSLKLTHYTDDTFSPLQPRLIIHQFLRNRMECHSTNTHTRLTLPWHREDIDTLKTWKTFSWHFAKTPPRRLQPLHQHPKHNGHSLSGHHLANGVSRPQLTFWTTRRLLFASGAFLQRETQVFATRWHQKRLRSNTQTRSSEPKPTLTVTVSLAQR